MHGNRIGKDSRHPIPEGLYEVTFGAKVLGSHQPITFAVTFDDTLGTQQRLAFRTMPVGFSSRMTVTFFIHVIEYRRKKPKTLDKDGNLK